GAGARTEARGGGGGDRGARAGNAASPPAAAQMASEPTAADGPWIRADGPAKVTGQARYTADLWFPGLAHARLLLAGRAHARIVRLDTARARALPGVLAVLTQDDVPAR